MKLAEFLNKETILVADSFEDTDAFYSKYAELLKANGIAEDAEAVKRLFIKRESVHSTGIKKGAAAPHIYSQQFSKFTFSLALVKKGLDFDAPDKKDVFLVFLLMSSDQDVQLHLKSLAHIARVVRTTGIVEAAKSCAGADELALLFAEKEKEVS